LSPYEKWLEPIVEDAGTNPIGTLPALVWRVPVLASNASLRRRSNGRRTAVGHVRPQHMVSVS